MNGTQGKGGTILTLICDVAIPGNICNCYHFSLRELCSDLKYCEDEPQRIGEVFAQSVSS